MFRKLGEDPDLDQLGEERDDVARDCGLIIFVERHICEAVWAQLVDGEINVGNHNADHQTAEGKDVLKKLLHVNLGVSATVDQGSNLVNSNG